MKAGRSQLSILLKTFLRLDWAGGKGMAGSKLQGKWALVLAAVFYVFMGLMLSASLYVNKVPLHAFATILYAAASVFVAFAVVVEYQEILLSPTDGDILYWRPVPSKTLFLARVLHILVYSSALTLCIQLPASFFAAARSEAPPILGFAAHLLPSVLCSAFAVSVAILLYGLLLRWIPSEKIKSVIAYAQVGMMILLFVGYQSIGPLLERFQESLSPEALEALHFSPTAWFAAIPVLVSEGLEPKTLFLAGLGLASLALTSAFAIRRFAPAYQEEIASATAGEGTRRAKPERVSALARGFARFVARTPAKRAGFEFFLGNLRGDPKLKVTLLPLMAMPVAFLVLALAQGGGKDPYEPSPAPESVRQEASERFQTHFRAVLDQRHKVRRLKAAPAPTEEAATEEKKLEEMEVRLTELERERDRASSKKRNVHMRGFFLFWAIYSLGMYCVTFPQLLAFSASWKAAWIYHVAPLRAFDGFYIGVLWGACYALLVPCLLLFAVALGAAWGNPLHALLHVLPAVVLLLVGFPLALFLRAELPFSKEPARQQRSSSAFLGLLILVPLGLVGYLHFQFRESPAALLFGSLALGGLGLLGWKGVSARIRRRFEDLPPWEGDDERPRR